ncbi:hypothetical protein ACT3UD_12905 [Glutamicibacter sp. 287]|uniref:hypothetical protein n=1 Tax=unclassified Glutamicibacter TaxID=2627139 RepID=UPI0040341744
MASKKKQGKKNSGAGNPAKAAQRGRSVFKVQAEISVDAMREDYAAWITETVPAFGTAEAAQIAEIQLGVVRSVGAQYAELARSSNLRDIDPELFGQVFAEFLVNLPEGLEAEPIFTAWLDYFSFLTSRGTWEGGEENLTELRELLDDALKGFAEEDAELCALLRGTELYAKVKAFSEALGDGVDISAFSEAGNEARVRVMNSVGVDAATVKVDEPAPDVFAHVWNAAILSVVDPSGGKIVRDEEAFAHFVEGEESESAQLLFEMGVGCVQSHLIPNDAFTERDEAFFLVLRNLLVTAVTGREADFEGLRRNCGPKNFDAVLPEAREALASLAAFGLLQVKGEEYGVDERLLPVISAGLSEAESLIEESE